MENVIKVKGEIIRVIWKSDDQDNLTKILQIKLIVDNSNLCVIGKVFGGEVGDTIEAEGVIEENQYGKQLKAHFIHIELPMTISGIKKYILTSSKGTGLGVKTIEKIVDLFKFDTLNVILDNPEKLKQIKGLNYKKIELARQNLSKDKKYRNIIMFLIDTCNFSSDKIISIYQKYKEFTIDIIKNNPYQLMTDFSRINFKIADAIAMKLGVSKKSPTRILKALLFVIENFIKFGGHCAILQSKLFEDLNILLREENEESIIFKEGVICDSIQKIFNEMINENIIYKDLIGKEWYVFPQNLYEAEKSIAICLQNLTQNPPDTFNLSDEVLNKCLTTKNNITEIQYTEEQKETIIKALKNKITIITGGPGTGKTTIIDGIIKLNQIIQINTGVNRTIELVAPTGKAANRMSEKTGKAAKTIHRLLGFGSNGELPSVDENSQLNIDILIVDEASMIDTILFNQLIKSINPNKTQLILVGDINQLPSIGSGNILKDLIASNIVEVAKLTKPQRNKENSGIVMNAHKINNGEFPIEDNKEFFIFEEDSNEDILIAIKQMAEYRLKDYFIKKGGLTIDGIKREFNPLFDLQILSPMNKGEIGNDILNKELQSIFNKNIKSVKSGKKEFKVGDKVIQTKNNKELQIFNGDIGYVTEINEIDNSIGLDKNMLKAQPVIEVWFENKSKNGVKKITPLTHENLEDLKLAYSISIHKSQGSEYPVVIIPITTSHYNMLERKLYYTGITRARQMVVLVGFKRALNIAVKNNKSEHRITGLKDRIKWSDLELI